MSQSLDRKLRQKLETASDGVDKEEEDMWIHFLIVILVVILFMIILPALTVFLVSLIIKGRCSKKSVAVIVLGLYSAVNVTSVVLFSVPGFASGLARDLTIAITFCNNLALFACFRALHKHSSEPASADLESCSDLTTVNTSCIHVDHDPPGYDEVIAFTQDHDDGLPTYNEAIK